MEFSRPRRASCWAKENDDMVLTDHSLCWSPCFKGLEKSKVLIPSKKCQRNWIWKIIRWQMVDFQVKHDSTQTSKFLQTRVDTIFESTFGFGARKVNCSYLIQERSAKPSRSLYRSSQKPLRARAHEDVQTLFSGAVHGLLLQSILSMAKKSKSGCDYVLGGYALGGGWLSPAHRDSGGCTIFAKHFWF